MQSRLVDGFSTGVDFCLTDRRHEGDAMDSVRACVDRALAPERLIAAAEWAMAARATNAPMRAPQVAATPLERFRMALDAEKLWPAGCTLRVRFLDGEGDVQSRVATVAQQWSNHANVTFEFGNDPQAEIRISFRGAGSWSFLGTDAFGVEPDEPTMNFGWLHPQSRDDEYARVVLHEFGHSLGCIHEHQNPEAAIPWDREAVYRYYAGPPNTWTREEVDQNLFEPYSRDRTQFTRFDPASIMVYPIPEQHTIGSYSIGLNSELSETDRRFIGTLYPFVQRSVVNLEVDGAEAEEAIGEHGEEDHFDFSIAQPGRYVIETHGPTDVHIGLFGPDSRTRLVAEDDDSGVSLNARIDTLLMAGRYFLRIRHSRPTGTGGYRVGVRTAS
jgi:hypothetical protein